MLRVLLCALSVSLAGCGTMRLDPADKNSRPSLSYVFRDVQGCKDKLSFTGTKVKLTMCFW
jgi:predicted small lipoprotein YifL